VKGQYYKTRGWNIFLKNNLKIKVMQKLKYDFQYWFDEYVLLSFNDEQKKDMSFILKERKKMNSEKFSTLVEKVNELRKKQLVPTA
jgi:hypothetical protein